jgi:hypothetical protein
MGARHQALKQPLTQAYLAKALHRLLPRRNNCCAVNYPELVEELGRFGVKNRFQLRKLILRHIREAIRMDQEPLDAMNAKIYRKELGNEKFLLLERRRIFFGWEALIRVILELEFGDRYREFADRRDRASA